MLHYEFLEPDQLISTREFHLIRTFLKTTGRTQIGWHYVIDLTWILCRVKYWPKRLRMLDAGGGTGPLQFLLAEMGFNVTNVDLALKLCPPKYQQRYGTSITYLEDSPKTEYTQFLERFHLNPSQSIINAQLQQIKKWKIISQLENQFYNFRLNAWRRRVAFDFAGIGHIDWKVGNLCHMNSIPTETFDAVVSLSALEHIPLDQLGNALAEIRRTLKKDSRWAATTSGTERNKTWFHDPSSGYCFSSKYIEELFQATPHRIQEPATVLQKYRECKYLKDNLAKFYFKSDKNGMPWGRWDPQYIPVAIWSDS
jgi:2-polyprenyl-3-methyl-5-hydroxy-6-metoxy-1,4-benzoquinol methylase